MMGTLRHYFPNFPELIDEYLVDPRRGDMCRYSLRDMVTFGLLLFFMQAGSRRFYRVLNRSAEFLANLAYLAGTMALPYAPHTDTLDYLLCHLDPQGLAMLAAAMTWLLVRNKVLDRYRFDNALLLAIDGVTVLSLRRELKIPCRTQREGDGVRSLCAAVEAKIVTTTGLAFHLAAAFEDQPDTDGSKQDCENKAFTRLAAELHRRHPRQTFCLLLDGLYANQGILQICRNYYWHYFITFKEGSIPNLAAATLRERARHPENTIHHQREDGVRQTIRWVCNQPYAGGIVHVIWCDEIWADGSDHHFCYLTDYHPHRTNVVKLINEGARQRWKIESSFDDQKNGGYELEHDFGVRGNAWKNYYYLVQIVHLIAQLAFHGDLCAKLQRATNPAGLTSTALELYDSIKGFFANLRTDLQTRTVGPLLQDDSFLRNIQIRLDTG